MKVAVVGATGGVGAHVTRIALERGFTVVALARNPANITAESTNLTCVAFDVRSPETLAEVLAGCSIVFSCLGNKGSPPIVAKGTAALLTAIAANGEAGAATPRLAIISSIGIGESAPQLKRMGFGGWCFACLFSTVLRATKRDLIAAEHTCLKAPLPEGVKCVVVRPAGLSNAPAAGADSVQTGDASADVGISVTRADLAGFIVSLAEETKFDGLAVSVGSKPLAGQASDLQKGNIS